MRILFYLGAAIFAFVSEAVLIRSVVARTDIDAATFVFVSLLSGSLMVLFLIPSSDEARLTRNSWGRSVLALSFAVFFTYALSVMSLSWGVLVLFGTVQVATVVLVTLFKGERLNLSQYFGMGLLMTGVLMIAVPMFRTFDTAVPLILMVLAGLAWAGCSFSETKLLQSTRGLTPLFKQLALLVLLFYGMAQLFMTPEVTIKGLAYAVIAGGLTGGLGYCLYRIVANSVSISATVASIAVLVFALFSCVLLLDEQLTNVELSSASLMLLGIAIYDLSRYLSSLSVESNDSLSS